METLKVFVDYCGNNYAVGCETYACVAVGNTLEDAKSEFAEAIEFHFEGMRTDGEVCPSQGNYTLVYELTIQALLQHYKSVINLSALSKVTGINKALLSHYASGIRTPRDKQREKIINGFHQIANDLASVF